MYKKETDTINLVNDPAVRYKKSIEGITKSQFLSIVAFTGLTLSAFSELLPVSRRTIEKVKDENLLRPDVSDRTLELGSLFQTGIELFGSKDGFLEWLNTTSHALGGEKPFALLHSTNGVSMVRDILGRVAHGVYS